MRIEIEGKGGLLWRNHAMPVLSTEEDFRGWVEGWSVEIYEKWISGLGEDDYCVVTSFFQSPVLLLGDIPAMCAIVEGRWTEQSKKCYVIFKWLGAEHGFLMPQCIEVPDGMVLSPLSKVIMESEGGHYCFFDAVGGGNGNGPIYDSVSLSRSSLLIRYFELEMPGRNHFGICVIEESRL